MKFSTSVLFTSLLLANPTYADDAVGLNLGPFNMEFNPVGHEYQINKGSRWEKRHIPNSRAFLDSPICYAISNLKNLEIVIELHEYVSSKEKKILIKKLTVEPYVFGNAQDGSLELKGKITTEKMLKEVNIKYGEDKFVDTIIPKKLKDKSADIQDDSEDESDEYTTYYDTGYFSGKYSSEKNNNVDIRRIRWIQVVEKSHFDVPKDYKQDNRDFMKVICQLPEMKVSNETAPAEK